MTLVTQTIAVISMNLKSLHLRFWMTLATLIAIAVVVAVLLAFQAMSNGFKATVNGSGADDVAIILRKGAQAELNSVLLREQINLIETAPGIVRNEAGPITSGEIYVIVDGKKRGTGKKVNLPLRGIGQDGKALRKNITIVQGRMFEAGKNELVVGSSVLKEFSGFEPGSQVKLANATWTVVGVFDAGGSVFGSEIWTDAKIVQTQFNRGSSVQVIRAKISTRQDIETIKAYAEKETRLNVDVFTEKEYYQEQASGMSDALFTLGWPLSIAMALGALAGALNTMYTSVQQRSVEIATLRAIGFSNVSAFFGTLVESLCIAILGGILGTFMAYLLFDGITTSTLGNNFTQVVFDFKIDMAAIKQGVIMALVIGFIGGFFPAFRASRLPVVIAFKAAP